MPDTIDFRLFEPFPVPLLQLQRNLCPEAFAPFEEAIERDANDPLKGQELTFVPDDGGPETTFVQGDDLLVLARHAVQLAGMLREQLASGAVDRWLAGHPDAGLTRAAVIAHIAHLCDLPRMRSVRPEDGKGTRIVQLVCGVCPAEWAAVEAAFAGLESLGGAPVHGSDILALAAALEAQLAAGAVDIWLVENPNPSLAIEPSEIIANGRSVVVSYIAHLRGSAFCSAVTERPVRRTHPPHAANAVPAVP
jgi:hypothetical protein